MTDIALTEGERTILVLLVADQLNRIESQRTMWRQTEELRSVLTKIQPADRQVFVRVP